MKNTLHKSIIKKMPAMLLLPLIMNSNDVSAQNATIKGTAFDSTMLDAAFVDIEIQGPSSNFAMTDELGNFLIPNLLAGNYKLIVTTEGYDTRVYDNIVLKDNDTATINVFIHQTKRKVEDIDGTEIIVQRNTNSRNAVIEETRLKHQVVSGVSQEQIKNSQDRNAAQVMSRIPGVTVVDGRFVMVRGIPERYNQVLLNNAIAPSTEVDRRTFSFDLIPSNVLDRMMIYKSGAPENTGDFAGGLIKVYTANAADENYTQVNLSTGYRTGTTGHDYVQSQGSKTDLLGFDNGFRALPGSFPKENLRGLPNRSQKRIDAAKSLKNNFAPKTSTAMPDVSVGVNLARRFFWGNTKVTTISALSYSQSYQTYDKSFSRYLELGENEQTAVRRFQFLDKNYEKENKIGAISNWNFQINNKNKIEFRNLFTQIGENITVLRNGEDFIQQSGLNRQNYLYQYRSRTVYSGQLEGTHDIKTGNKNSKLNWVLGMNYLGEDQPDLRRFRTIETAEGSGEYRMILPPSSNLYDAGRFYSKLKETSFNNSLNYTVNLNENVNPIQLKAGYMLDYRKRTFETRYFSYMYPGSSSFEELQRLERLPLDQIFDPNNMSLNDGFSIEEGTRASDSYEASNFLAAGYVGTVIPLGELTLSGGFRLEYNQLKLNTESDAGKPINVNNPILSPLGFFNADYNVTEKTKLRFAYYKSVNRPEFRELAPFLFYDYQFDAEKYGNPDLKTAKIDNLDLRYEIYPRKGESISIGAFYKHFTNPIETQILIRSESPAFSYQNAAMAYSRGIELELRKSLEGVTGSKFLDNISLNLNAAYIQSQVNYGSNASTGQDAKRALQGQSPYIINGMISYNNPTHKFQVNASYNVFGKRIYAVGSMLFPTIYEMPRQAVDITISKQLSNNWNIKLGIQDVLNSANRFYQDTDRDGKIEMNGIDSPIFNYKRGTLFNLSLSYKF